MTFFMLTQYFSFIICLLSPCAACWLAGVNFACATGGTYESVLYASNILQVDRKLFYFIGK